MSDGCYFSPLPTGTLTNDRRSLCNSGVAIVPASSSVFDRSPVPGWRQNVSLHDTDCKIDNSGRRIPYLSELLKCSADCCR
jgi:hypothetical protein